MEKLARRNTAHVLDLLNARMRFEQTGVKLYDEVIRKIEQSSDARYQVLLDTLRHNRDEEQEHAIWLEEQIRRVGGRPEETTAFARLEDEESLGIKNVILDGHTRILDVLHALLTAEAADNAGWDLLVKLADEADDTTAKAAFAYRLAQEAQHLLYLREVIHRGAELEVLGMPVQMPASLARAMAKKPAAIATALIGVGVTVAGAFALRRALA